MFLYQFSSRDFYY